MEISPPLYSALSVCFPAPPGNRFDIGACYNRTRGCSFFPKMPIDVCEDYCGSPFGYYNLSAVFAALTAWVIPLFALLANMHFADSTFEGLEWCRTPKVLNQRWLTPLWNMTKSQLPKHFVCAVQLANPVGTIWSLAVKLDLGQQLWNYCNDQRLPKLDGEGRRNVAHLCYCLDDFGHEVFEDRVDRLIQLLNNPRTSANVYKYVEKTSGALAFARARNTRHTMFAILVYIGMAVSTLLASTTSSGLDYSQPHTIALRELCFFILAQVILSSAAGAWSQQSAPQAEIAAFAKRIRKIEKGPAGQPALWEQLAVKEIALWDGGSYVFRPQKSKKSHARNAGGFSCGNLSWRHLCLLGTAFLIVIFAFAMSFTISYSTPTKGIGGRGLAEILYLIVWIVNSFIDVWMTHKTNDDDNGRKRLFVLIWQKDAIISLLVLLFFFLPFIGKPYSREIRRSILFAHLNFQVGTIPANRGQLGSAFMTKPM